MATTHVYHVVDLLESALATLFVDQHEVIYETPSSWRIRNRCKDEWIPKNRVDWFATQEEAQAVVDKRVAWRRVWLAQAVENIKALPAFPVRIIKQTEPVTLGPDAF